MKNETSQLKISLCSASEDTAFNAKYYLYYAESVLWLFNTLCKSYQNGHDNFDMTRFFDSLYFLSGVANSCISECSDLIERIEKIPDFEKIYVITQTVDLMQLENKTFDEASKCFTSFNLPTPNESEVNGYIKFLESLEKNTEVNNV